MADTKNALAELAERMDILVVATLCTIPSEYSADLRKVQRIVAELAKVKTQGLQYNQMLSEFMCVFTQCRAIAEEGEKSGE